MYFTICSSGVQKREGGGEGLGLGVEGYGCRRLPDLYTEVGCDGVGRGVEGCGRGHLPDLYTEVGFQSNNYIEMQLQVSRGSIQSL